MRYFTVTVTRGHLGCKRGQEIRFAIAAKNISEACKKAQQMPAVKHSGPVAYANEITREEYQTLRKLSAYETAR